MDASHKPYKPSGPVQSILAETLLQEKVPESHFKELRALPKKFSSNTKAGAAKEGKIRVNKEVLAVLKQVSAELDAAQRHYLAFKQFGDAGESLLKLSPDIVSLPTEGLATAASQADVAAGDAGAEGEQQNATTARSSTDGAAGAGGQAAAVPKDLLVGHRRWGYFPMLQRLRATSAKQMRPPQVPALQLEAKARRSADEVAAPAAAEPPAGDEDIIPDSPKMSWGALMRQKKAEKEQGIARMVRIKHATLVIQRAWRAFLNKRASRALAMMVLRAKVRRAHRAAYVSNLLRRKPKAAATDADSRPSDTQTAEAEAESDSDAEVHVDEQGEVVLTQQQEAEFELQLQQALHAAEAGKKAVLPLELAHLAELLPDHDSSAMLAGLEDSSSGDGEEEEEEQAPMWKVISTPKAGLKRPLLRVDTQSRIPSGPNWAGSLRTPGPATSHLSATTPHRIGSPDSPPSGKHGHSSSNSPFKDSPRGPRPRSTKTRRPSSRPASRANGSLPAAGTMSGSGSPDRSPTGRDGSRATGDGGSLDEAGGRGSSHSARRRPGVSFALGGGDDGGEGVLLSEGSSGSSGGGTARLEGSAAEGSAAHAAGGRTARGVRVGKKGVGIVVAAAKNAVAIANSEGEVVIRARSASKKLLKSISRAATTATGTASAAVTSPPPGSAGAGVAMAGGAADGDGEQVLLLQQHADGQHLQLQRPPGTAGSSAAGLEGSAWGPSDPAMLDGGRAGNDGGAQGADGMSAYRQSVTAGGRRVTGQQGGASEGLAAGRVGSATPPQSRRTTMELGGGSRAGTPPPNRGFSAASSGNAAFSRYERGLGDGLQTDFRVLQPQSVTASSRAATPPAGSQHEAQRRSPTPPRRLSTAGSDGTHGMPLAGGEGGEGRSGRSSPDLQQQQQQHRHQQLQDAATAEQQVGESGQWQQEQAMLMLQQNAQHGGLQAPGRQQGGPGDQINAVALQQWQQQQQQEGQAGGHQYGGGAGGMSTQQPWHEGQAQQQQQQQLYKLPSGATRGGFSPDLQLSITSRMQAAAAGTGWGDPTGAVGAESAANGLPAGGHFLKISSFSRREEDAAVAARTSDALGMQQYAAAVAAYRAAGLADPSALRGLVLGADGTVQEGQEGVLLLQDPQQQQQQQVSKAEGWYRRLLMAKAKAVGRQPWDPPAAAAAAGGAASSGPLSWRDYNAAGEGSALSLGASAGQASVRAGLGADPSSSSTAAVGPVGVWGRRGTVRDAWLFVDGRATAALPWQALAAVAAADSSKDAGTGVQGGEGGGLAGGMDGGLSQLTVRGRRLLVRLMWLKSAAGVVRGRGGDARFLEQRLVRLLQQETKPAGLELLLWSVADEQQQQEEARVQLRARQQQLLQLLRRQQQQLWQGNGGFGPASMPGGVGGGGGAGAADTSLSGGLGGVWRQQSAPEKALQPYRHTVEQMEGQGVSAGVPVGVPGRSQKAVAAGSSGGWFGADLGRQHGEHLPLLPAARCAPLLGGRRATQTMLPAPQQPLELMSAVTAAADAAAVDVQQQQQRRWHFTVDDLALRSRQQQGMLNLEQQQHREWSQQQEQQSHGDGGAEASPSTSGAAVQPMSVHRKRLMRRTADFRLGSDWTAGGHVYVGVLQLSEAHASAVAHQQQQQVGLKSMAEAAAGQKAAGTWQQQQQVMQLPSWQPQGVGVASGQVIPPLAPLPPVNTLRWREQQQRQQQQQQELLQQYAQQYSVQQLLQLQQPHQHQEAFLAVSGEGDIAVPVLRQPSLPLQTHAQAQKGLQPPPQQQQHQPQFAQQHQQQQTDPAKQLWLIPELSKLQSTAASQQAFVSFVSTKPQQQRRRTRQQQQQKEDSLHQHQQQDRSAAVGLAAAAARGGDAALYAESAMQQWGQLQPRQPVGLMQRQQQQQQLGKDEGRLPQLPGMLRMPPLQRQQQQGASCAGPATRQQEGQQVEQLSAARPARLSSSDPGSGALLGAVAAARHAAVKVPVAAVHGTSSSSSGTSSMPELRGSGPGRPAAAAAATGVSVSGGSGGKGALMQGYPSYSPGW